MAELFADLKARWLSALRDGEYKQGRAQLRCASGDNGDAFCCLGVLVDIVDPNLWIEYGSSSWGLPLYLDDEVADVEEGELTPDLLERTGLSYDDCIALIELNDGSRNNYPDRKGMHEWKPGKEPKSFHEIADYIEKNL